jgi:Flp pilus assembly protein TadD
MSLLLEALKKAELAKQAAKEQPPTGDTPPFTRDKLPDISQPMEIRSEDLSLVEPTPAPKREEKPALELALEEAPRAAPPPPPPPQPPHVEPVAQPIADRDFALPSDEMERKQAQQLFEAKEMDVNPRKPFYITLAALGVFALGAVGYIWYEMQPKNNYTVPPPSAQSAQPAVAPPPMAAAPAPEPAAPAATAVTPPAGSQPAMPATIASAPGAAPAPAAPAAAPSVVPATRRAAASARQTAAATTTAPEQAAARRRDGDIKITSAQTPQTDPVLLSAYQAFNAGDLARARDGYQQVLRAIPNNRDALLGLAAIETQDGQYAAAERFYVRLLELDPRDAHAQAGLIGLKGQIDPVSAESRLKTMIAAQPEAHFLNFTLGNQYAAQGRWAEAQQAYFRAYTGDPEHPDFAYNLAVSLDKMHQSGPALEYYRRALALAKGHQVSFDTAQVSKRVSQLAR